MSKLIDQAIYTSSTHTICHLVKKRLAWVGGLENIPQTGSFILIANHASFFDHLLVGTVINAVRYDKAYFLTKAESFTSSLKRRWHFSLGAIPIQRDKPDRDALRAIYEILESGHPLVIYPEGTRGPGWPLLPFKDGAFRFALKSGVPIVPAGIVGTKEILPKGSFYPKRQKAGICFGQPLSNPSSKDKAEQLTFLREKAEESIKTLMQKTSEALEKKTDSPGLAKVVDNMIEELLEKTSNTRHMNKRDITQLSRAIEISQICNEDDIETEVVALRVQGLRSMSSSGPMRILRGYSLRRKALEILSHDPINEMANYVLGRWYLGVPKFLGGSPRRAIEHLSIAATLTRDDCRFHISLAEALIASNEKDRAEDIIAQVMMIEQHDERSTRRVAKANELLTCLRTDNSSKKLTSSKAGQ